jgi:hypothetical protein
MYSYESPGVVASFIGVARYGILAILSIFGVGEGLNSSTAIVAPETGVGTMLGADVGESVGA